MAAKKNSKFVPESNFVPQQAFVAGGGNRNMLFCVKLLTSPGNNR